MVRDTLGDKFSRLRRFLEYEASLTTPEKLTNPGGHYRTLLKKFLASEPNSRIEEERKTRSTVEESWHCEFDKCNGGVIYEDGVPLELCHCALTQALSPERREKLLSAVVDLRLRNSLPIRHEDARHTVSGSRVA
jgi:hypothetical protein